MAIAGVTTGQADGPWQAVGPCYIPARMAVHTEVRTFRAAEHPNAVQLVRQGVRDIWSRRRLARYLVQADLHKHGADTLLGNIWWFLDPLLQMVVYVILVSVIFDRGGEDYPLFIFAAILPWKWFSSSINDAQAENAKADKPLAYTINLDFMSKYGDKRGGTYVQPGHKGYPNDVIFVFDPGFEEFVEEAAKQLAKNKNDKNLFGYFSDNEMPLLRKNLDGYLKLPPTEPGYVAAKKWADERGITLETITDQHRQDFLAFAAERYFSASWPRP